MGLARLGAELRTRPRLREALRSGRVGLRAAETVLPVATGEAEALWVERSVLDLGLDLAGLAMPRSSRSERLEALAQEYLGEFPTGADGDETRPLGPAFGAIGPGDADRRAALEEELERWVDLPPVLEWAAPEAGFDEAATAQEVDRRLRALGALRARWEDLIGLCAHAIRRSEMHLRLGFANFRHFVEERLQLPPRAVEQRAAFEERLSRSAALQEARRHRLSYERLRLLARLPEGEIKSWILRAKALTASRCGGRWRASGSGRCVRGGPSRCRCPGGWRCSSPRR